jgi:extracellular matrix protein 14
MILRPAITIVVGLLVILLGLAAPSVALSNAGAAHPGSWSSPGGHHHSSAISRGHNGHLFPFLTWLRDSTIEIVFGRPTSRSKKGTAQNDASLRRDYSNDVVIRFNVTTAEEEKALSDAADRLFLDIWAFTADFVDIRLHKDDIASLLTLLPQSLHKAHAPLIQDLTSAIWANYPSKSFGRAELDSSPLDPATVRRSRDGTDNIFFRDYQPMPVRAKPPPPSCVQLPNSLDR